MVVGDEVAAAAETALDELRVALGRIVVALLLFLLALAAERGEGCAVASTTSDCVDVARRAAIAERGGRGGEKGERASEGRGVVY